MDKEIQNTQAYFLPKKTYFENLMAEHAYQLHALALVLTGDDLSKAQIIIRRAIHKAYQILENYNSRLPFFAWISTIIKDEYLKLIRKPDNKDINEKEKFPLQQVDRPLSGEERLYLKRLIKNIPAQSGEIVKLVVLEKRSYKEAAGIIGISVQTLKTILHRARKELLIEALSEKKLWKLDRE